MSTSNSFSAASSNSPFESLGQPIFCRSYDLVSRRNNCAEEPAFLDRREYARRLGNGQTFFRESKYCEHLFTVHAGKPLEELIDCRPGLQILKKRFHRHPRVFESPSPAQVSAERSTAVHAVQSIMPQN